jgi:putative ABC transport system ATP-binding protein
MLDEHSAEPGPENSAARPASDPGSGARLVALGIGQDPPHRRMRIGDEATARSQCIGDPRLGAVLRDRYVDMHAVPPIGQLDRGTSRQIMRLLRAVVAEGVTALVATHDPGILDMADSVLHLVDGRITT